MAEHSMHANPRQLCEQLRDEADRILASELRDVVLSKYGEVHLVGSYALGLMTWRDLDIHVVQRSVTVADCFVLGGRIASLLKPGSMHFATRPSSAHPSWVVLGRVSRRRTCRRVEDRRLDDGPGWIGAVREYTDSLKALLSEPVRAIILDVKAACWRHPEYRRRFTSTDVYSAVLDRGVRDVDGFSARRGPADRAKRPFWRRLPAGRVRSGFVSAGMGG